MANNHQSSSSPGRPKGPGLAYTAAEQKPTDRVHWALPLCVCTGVLGVLIGEAKQGFFGQQAEPTPVGAVRSREPLVKQRDASPVTVSSSAPAVESRPESKAALAEFDSARLPAFKVSMQIPKHKTFAEQISQWNADITPEQQKELQDLVGELEASVSRAAAKLKDSEANSSTSPAVDAALSLQSELQLVRAAVLKECQPVVETHRRSEDMIDIASSRRHVDAANYSKSAFMVKYGAPDVFLRRIIKEVTGHELGMDVQMSISGALPQPFTANPLTLEVAVYEGKATGKYEAVLARLACGTGVLMKQLTERAEAGVDMRLAGGELTAPQHACAIALQNVVIGHLHANYPEFLFDVHMLSDSLFREPTGELAYDSGREIYNAALTALGSPTAAFNYLLTHQELSEEMESALKQAARGAQPIALGQRRVDVVLKRLSAVSDAAAKLLAGK